MPKYDAMRKIWRNEMIRKMHAEHPELSYNELAKQFDISRQRVGQILQGPTYRKKKGQAA